MVRFRRTTRDLFVSVTKFASIVLWNEFSRAVKCHDETEKTTLEEGHWLYNHQAK